MTRIITFLGHAETGQTALAIATARWFAQQGKRALLVTHVPSVQAELLLETTLTATPQAIAPQFYAVQLQATTLLEQVWDEVKKWLTSYIPNSVSIDIYPAEVILLPGFDSLLAFNAIRKYFESDEYDVIVYDGREGLETLRMIGIPTTVNWYFRRFHQVFEALDISKIADSIGGPIASALVAVNIDNRRVQESVAQVRSWIDRGVAIVQDAQQLTAYLTTTETPAAIATARWLWGSAQQVDLQVSGVLVHQASASTDLEKLRHAFEPLEVYLIPASNDHEWSSILAALPDFNVRPPIPQSVIIDKEQRQVRIFLPGFTKHQVRLSQSTSELTIEAGDQRRNIALPPEWSGLPVASGKFETPYLIVSF
jgi:arsenite-transporting ATPase